MVAGLDRTFLDLSSKMAEPFCVTFGLLRYRLIAPLDPKKFENCESLPQEVAIRALICSGALLGLGLCAAMPVPMIGGMLALGVASKIFRAIGFALQEGGYTHVRGLAPEKTLHGLLKLMTWNVCGIGGGMSLDHGGVPGWRSRIDAIVEQIKKEDPDVLVLQEIYDAAFGEALIERLKNDYAHFFTHLGPNVIGSVGGIMVISKCAVHTFAHESFENNKWDLNRGFATLDVLASPEADQPCVRVIGTHLIHGDAPKDQDNRLAQIAQVVNAVAKQTLQIPTLVAGDLNIERDQKEGKVLSSLLRHAYQGSEPTCTNHLAAQWDAKTRSVWGETIDYISLLQSTDTGVQCKDCHLVEAFDASYNTKTAFSDHHGIAVTVEYNIEGKNHAANTTC